jgi:hypothetical protein
MLRTVLFGVEMMVNAAPLMPVFLAICLRGGFISL